MCKCKKSDDGNSAVTMMLMQQIQQLTDKSSKMEDKLNQLFSQVQPNQANAVAQRLGQYPEMANYMPMVDTAALARSQMQPGMGCGPVAPGGAMNFQMSGLAGFSATGSMSPMTGMTGMSGGTFGPGSMT